ncbi:response regulator [Cohnella rhizosphaerae]|uniref:Response regulator n=1 Tax=Cohnella rhizosphaerae TaxID=1457232 RepID=A0A9X4KUM2_9BACL|nr:response regulator [Cohnella rhizosphaerae]MDG0811350.1 response regulator [Cohnella rhizosphaerae]
MTDNDINVLLVDDEAVDLEWLRRRVAGHEQLAGASVRTATSGFAALELMKGQRVDIILSDIRMPIMSGTEFARQAKEINPQVSIVFISGHEDFNYAKQAIQLNAHGYLLKPVEDGELNATLTELCGKIERERRQHTSLTETLSLVNQELLLRWFNESAPGDVEAHIRSFLAPMLQEGTAVAIAEIDDLAWKTSSSTAEERRAWLAGAAAFIRRFAQERNMGLVIDAYDSRFVLLAAVPEPSFPRCSKS